MNSPFEGIRTSPKYLLRSTWGCNKDIITSCLQKTYDQYKDTDLITYKHFNTMITDLTRGAGSSVLAYRRDPEIITKLCTLFPDFMNDTKVIGNLIKCMNIQSYPQSCITEIMNIGYKFTDDQIAYLNKNAAYNVFDIIDTMTYKDLLALFENNTFMNKLLANLYSDYDTPTGKVTIDAKIVAFRDIINQFGLVIDGEFVTKFLSSASLCGSGPSSMINYSHIVLNIHIIAKELGLDILPASAFVLLCEKHPQFFSIYETSKTYYNIFTCFQKETIITNCRKILKFYDNPVTRNFVLQLMSPDVFVTFVTPSISNYDPIEDIFFILVEISEKSECADARYIIVKHLLDDGYLIYDRFLMLLISLGLADSDRENNQYSITDQMTILIECMQKGKMIPTLHEIHNIFTFCNYATINALASIKIIPTKELLSLNLYPNVVKSIVDNSVFIDDDTIEYSELISLYKSYNYTTVTIDQQIKIYESLNKRDKQIYIRSSYKFLSDVIKYRITLTQEYVFKTLCCDNWRDVIFLLHLSREYDYIIDFIDEQMIMMIPNGICRLWFYNNLIIERKTSFALSNKFYKIRTNIENDVNTLLSKPIVQDVNALKRQTIQQRENARLECMAKGHSIKKAKIQSTSISGSTAIKTNTNNTDSLDTATIESDTNIDDDFDDDSDDTESDFYNSKVIRHPLHNLQI